MTWTHSSRVGVRISAWTCALDGLDLLDDRDAEGGGLAGAGLGLADEVLAAAEGRDGARLHLGRCHEAHLLDGARDGRRDLDLAEAVAGRGGHDGPLELRGLGRAPGSGATSIATASVAVRRQVAGRRGDCARGRYRYRARGAPGMGWSIAAARRWTARQSGDGRVWRDALASRWVTPPQRCYHGTLALTVLVPGRRIDGRTLRRVLRMPPQAVRQQPVARAEDEGEHERERSRRARSSRRGSSRGGS